MSDAPQPDPSKATPPMPSEESKGHEGAAVGRPESARPSKPARRKVSKEEITALLAAHELWRKSDRKRGAQFVIGSDEDMSGVDLGGANLSWADLRNANLSGAKLRRVDLIAAVLRRANLSVADLSKANLSKADLSEANLSGVDLGGANLSWADLSEANLSGVDFGGANLSWAHLSEADLSGAKLWMVNLSGAHLAEANLGGANLWIANLSGADLMKANLTRAILIEANLSGANLRSAALDGADVRRASLVGVQGLFGRDRASGLGTVKNAEWAVYGRKGDFAHWAILRFMGTLHLFSASYVVFIAVTVYATAMRWLNTHVDLLHKWADEHGGGPASELAALVARIPLLPVQRHFGLLLLATFLLAVATTLHALFCPEPIKEATETRWARELNQPLIEYRSAMYSRFWVRYFTFVFFVLGGGYTLGYLVWRAARALWFLLSC